MENHGGCPRRGAGEGGASSDQARALLHVHKPPRAPFLGQIALLRHIETNAVVNHLHPKNIDADAGHYLHVLRFPGTDRVHHRLLDDLEDRRTNLERQDIRSPFDRKTNVAPGKGAHLGGKPVQRGVQAVFQPRGVELEEEGTRFEKGVGKVRPRSSELFARTDEISPVEKLFREVDHQSDAGKLLNGAVVEIPRQRDALPLRKQHSCEKPALVGGDGAFALPFKIHAQQVQRDPEAVPHLLAPREQLLDTALLAGEVVPLPGEQLLALLERSPYLHQVHGAFVRVFLAFFVPGAAGDEEFFPRPAILALRLVGRDDHLVELPDKIVLARADLEETLPLLLAEGRDAVDAVVQRLAHLVLYFLQLP